MANYLEQIKSTIDTYVKFLSNNETQKKFYENVPEGADEYTWKYSNMTGINLTLTLEELFDRAKDDEEAKKYIYESLYSRFPRGGAFLGDSDNDGDIDDDDLNSQVTPEEAEPTAKPTAEPTPEPEPEWVKSTDYDVVDDEESFNESLANGTLKKYYEKYPDEDRYNTVEHRACNFNDKVYDVSIDEAETEEFEAHWVSDTVQSISNGTDTYYLDIFYSLDDKDHELFEDAECTETTGKMAKFTAIKWNDETCPHCYEGAINAPDSSLADSAWICPNFDGETTETVKFDYDGTELTPWSKPINWGVASAKKDLDIEEFDSSKLTMYILK